MIFVFLCMSIGFKCIAFLRLMSTCTISHVQVTIYSLSIGFNVFLTHTFIDPPPLLVVLICPQKWLCYHLQQLLQADTCFGCPATSHWAQGHYYYCYYYYYCNKKLAVQDWEWSIPYQSKDFVKDTLSAPQFQPIDRKKRKGKIVEDKNG